jgi:hypothetical protein
MKEGKEGDTSHGESHGKFFIDGDGQAEGKDGSSDRNLDREKRDSDHPENSTDEHEANEGERYGPDRTTPHLGA